MKITDIQRQLNNVVRDFIISPYLIEVKYNTELKPTHVYLLSNKLNYPQDMYLKINIAEEYITEIYPSLLLDTVKKSNELLFKDIEPNQEFIKYKNFVPYYSLEYIHSPSHSSLFYNEETYDYLPMGDEYIILQKKYHFIKNYTRNNKNLYCVLPEIKSFIEKSGANYHLLTYNDENALSSFILGYNPINPQFKEVWSNLLILSNE